MNVRVDGRLRGGGRGADRVRRPWPLDMDAAREGVAAVHRYTAHCAAVTCARIGPGMELIPYGAGGGALGMRELATALAGQVRPRVRAAGK